MFEAGRKNTFAEGTLASSAMSSEKRLGQALIMDGGIQSAGEALAGQDARILWISVDQCCTTVYAFTIFTSSPVREGEVL